MKFLCITMLLLVYPLIIYAQWVQTNLNPGIGYCLYSDGTTIYAGTNEGVYYTETNGDPWFSIGPSDLVFSLVTAGDTIVAGSGTGKGIWYTADLGENWIKAAGIDSQSANILCKHDQFLFAGSWGGGVFRSGTNGSSWQSVGLVGEPVEAMLSVGDILLAGGMGIQGARAFFSTDNGESWDYRDLPYPTSRIHCFAHKDGKIFAGTDGGIYSSSDPGHGWTLEYGVKFDSSGNVIDTKMFKELLVYDQYLIASILFNSIWISADNGRTWNSFNEGLITDWSFEGLVVKNPDIWSLRSMFGNAYRRPLSDLVTGLQVEKASVPDQIRLFQNYPNPFNPLTVIRWQLANASQVELSIYNLLGEKVTILVSKPMQAGEHSYTFDASGLSSGVYYYQLTAGTFREARKMILLQ